MFEQTQRNNNKKMPRKDTPIGVASVRKLFRPCAPVWCFFCCCGVLSFLLSVLSISHETRSHERRNDEGSRAVPEAEIERTCSLVNEFCGGGAMLGIFARRNARWFPLSRARSRSLGAGLDRFLLIIHVRNINRLPIIYII